MASSMLNPIRIPAAQYVRVSRSTVECPEEVQKQVIAKYAEENGFVIKKKYQDINRRGLSIKSRNGFQQLLADVVGKTARYKAILVFDTSRWGRFQNTDEAAYYEFLCKSEGVTVHYCGEPHLNDSSPAAQVLKSLKRIKAAEYSRRLSVRCFDGQKRIAELGFRVGAEACYGYCRAMVDRDGKQVCLLNRGQRKFLHSCRTILVPGPDKEIEIVRDIFHFYLRHKNMTEIAHILNARGLRQRNGRPWSAKVIHMILTNPAYIGINVWNRRTTKLASRDVRNTRDKWVYKRNAFPAIITSRQFRKVQERLVNRVQDRSDEQLLDQLQRFVKERGCLSAASFGGRNTQALPCLRVYTKRFGNLRRIYTLIGYEPPIGTFKKVDTRQRGKFIRERVIQEVTEIFGRNVQVSHHPYSTKLTFKGSSTVGIHICHQKYRQARFVWRVYWGINKSREFDLLCLLDKADSNILRYYLVKTPEIICDTDFDLNNVVVKTGIRIRHLEQLRDAICHLKSRAISGLTK